MKVYIGHDLLEAEAARVAAKTLRDVSGIEAEFLCQPKLRDQGLYTRIEDTRGHRFDLVSGVPTSTQFSVSRFLTPLLCQTGFALFCDCDTVFLRDPREMLPSIRAEHAVSVVKHDYTSSEQWKMVGQPQKVYDRKNWSSVMLFNCDHIANRRLSLRDINERDRIYLHQFGWLHDAEIGSLPPEWNWLVDVEPMPENCGIAHMTLGGPWLPGWQGGGSYDEAWKAHAACY